MKTLDHRCRADRGFLAGVALLAALWSATACITSARIDELGAKEAEKVAKQMGILGDAELERYVERIGRRLAAASARAGVPWQFQIVDTPEPNAFALPGGYVYVSRGLLALVNSEDELAGVIGHEIGHVTAAHAEKRIRASIATSPVSVASGLAGFAAGIVSPSIGRLVSGTGQVLTAGLVIAPYSRSQENEADGIGQQLAAKTGYDPAGISHFLHTLGREVTLLAGKERRPSFLDTHPMTADRVARTRQRTAELTRVPGEPIARDQADLFATLEGIIVGNDPAKGVFQENVFLHPELDLVLTFPVGWKPVNTPEAAGALSPAGDALVSASIAEQNTSLDTVVKKLEAEQTGLRLERFTVRDLPAARTRVAQRSRFVAIALIEYRGDVYAVLGQSTGQNAAEYAPVFDATTQSFRAMRTSERKGLSESRLRVRKALVEETPAELARRTGSDWSAEQVAVANALAAGARLRSGQLMKVGIPQAYTSRR
jgi:predicted Zn-dependent protease